METHRRELLSLGYARLYAANINKVPTDIIALLSTYYRTKDVWDLSMMDRFIKVDCQSISCHIDGWPYRLAFGCDVASYPLNKKWRLSILAFDHRARAIRTVIGIIEDSKAGSNIVGNFYDHTNEGYALKGYDGSLYHAANKPMKRKRKYSNKVCELFEGDEVLMLLNMKRGTLSFEVNEEKYGVAFDDIDQSKKYRLCVGLCKYSAIRIDR